MYLVVGMEVLVCTPHFKVTSDFLKRNTQKYPGAIGLYWATTNGIIFSHHTLKPVKLVCLY